MININGTKAELEFQKGLEQLGIYIEEISRQLSQESGRDVIESISSRIKSAESIEAKLERKGHEISLECALQKLNDIAGMRIVCPYTEDLYRVKRELKKMEAIRVVKVKDFVKKPKKSGYRSLHMILEIPVVCEGEERKVRVELQLRTIIMHFWARLDHRNNYKQDQKQGGKLYRMLMECAEAGRQMDTMMSRARRQAKRDEIGM